MEAAWQAVARLAAVLNRSCSLSIQLGWPVMMAANAGLSVVGTVHAGGVGRGGRPAWERASLA
eukprot:349294-Heterocapsa_arctica.AAC.1